MPDLSRPTPEALHALEGLARAQAWRFRGAADLDDLRGVALLGLYQAAQRWDERRGVRFNTYATRCIVGSLQDYTRRERAWKANTAEWPARDRPGAQDVEAEALGRMEHTQALRALQWLPERERSLLAAHYREGRTDVELAREIGVTPGRVRQLWAQGLRRARRMS